MRLFAYIYAKIFGYFWLPCPRCGKMFGGHERKGSIFLSENHGKGTCCLPDEWRDHFNSPEVLKKMWQENFADLPKPERHRGSEC